jgi:uncharacterized protein (TIRG00374 family)
VSDVVTIERGRTGHQPWRILGGLVIVALLLGALWFQRATVSGAVEQIGSLSAATIGLILVLCVYERWSRANIVMRLLGAPVGIRTGLVIHDVGNAVSKGIPFGGALGTALRWQISRDRQIPPERFATMLVAYGIATTFASWLLPFLAMSIDLTRRPAQLIDVAILGVITIVLTASATFWAVVLRSDRLESWTERRLRRLWETLSRRAGSLANHDPAAGVAAVRRELFEIGRRPWSLMGRTLLSQGSGALILIVALRGFGVGDELGVTEFFRVFFVASLLGTFAPTPGGVGVIEAGVTGALVAAGVDTTTALAGVLVYRLITYVVPIALGAVLYVAWRIRRRKSAVESSESPASTACADDEARILAPSERANTAPTS